MTLFMAGVKVLLLLLILRSLQELLCFFGLVGGGVCIHDTHVVKTVRPLHPEVSDKEIPLQLTLVF